MPEGFGNPFRTIPHRTIAITAFDYSIPEVIEPRVLFERLHSEMGVGDDAEKSGVHHLPEIGWQLKPHQFEPGNVHELEIAASGVQTVASGKLQVADAMQEVSVNAPPDGPGLGGGLAAYAAETPMITKLVPQGASFESLLAGPDTPDMDEDPEALDWVALTFEPHLPTEPISFRLTIPGGGVDTFGPFVVLAFSGPAGSSKRLTGNGQYMLKLYGSGVAKLFETGVVPGDSELVLRQRFQFRWCESMNAITATTVAITISSDAFDDGTGLFRGNRILFNCNSFSEGGSSLINSLIEVAIGASRKGARYDLPIYRVPHLTNEPCAPASARVALRRDIRGLFQVVKHTYPETGYLEDSAFTLDFYPTDRAPLYFEWYANKPEGTGISVQLFYLDPVTEVVTELPGVNVLEDAYGGVNEYEPIPGVNSYWPKFTWETDGERTATLKNGWRCFREAVFESVDVESFEIDMRRDGDTSGVIETTFRSIAIQGPTHESADEMATIGITDIADRYPVLREVAQIPVHIETTYNEEGDRTTLFRGFTQNPDFSPREPNPTEIDGTPRLYPSPEMHEGTLVLAGFWLRLAKAQTPRRFTWLDRVANKPYKVTDVIRTYLECVLPPDMVDVPDLPLRLSGTNEDELNTEPNTLILNEVNDLARSYFGAVIIPDWSAGDNGMARLILPPGLPTYPLVELVKGHPGDDLQPASVSSYGTTTNGEQLVLRSFIRGGTYSHSWEPPEGNVVIVRGGGSFDSESGDSAPVQLSQMAFNVNSFNFLGLDPSHDRYPRPSLDNPDYLARFTPIRVNDASFATQAIVDWATRIVFLSSCFAKKIVRCVAPLLLVTDDRDELQQRPRPLRFGDAVRIAYNEEDIRTGIVRRCDPFADAAGNQWAQLTIVFSKGIDTYGWHSDRDRQFKSNAIALQRLFGMSLLTPQTSAAQRGHVNGKGAWMALPEPSSGRIQDLDPESETFGELYWTLDFSPLE